MPRFSRVKTVFTCRITAPSADFYLGLSVPEVFTTFGTFFELMCGPRGIAAAVAAKNMPLACFLNASTVLQALISILDLLSRKLLQLPGFSLQKTTRLLAPSLVSNCANTLMQYRDGIYR